MLRLLAYEHIDGELLAGVQRRDPTIEFVRVQDVGLRQTPDSVILEWATQVRFNVVTHDVNTVPGLLYERVDRGAATAGVFIISTWMSMGNAIDDLTLLALATDCEDWKNRVEYLPLR